jgi:hypothetical protein
LSAAHEQGAAPYTVEWGKMNVYPILIALRGLAE